MTRLFFIRMQESLLDQFRRRIFEKWHAESSVGSIFRNMTMLASGSILARGIGVLTAPIVTRIYSPEHFGVLSVFIAITAMLVPFGTFRYSAAVPLPKNDGLAANLSVLCMFCLLFMFFVILHIVLAISSCLAYFPLDTGNASLLVAAPYCHHFYRHLRTL